jgi:exonuclease III
MNTNIYNIQKDYIKIGVINIQKGLNNKIDDLLEYSIDKSYHILALTEIGKTNNKSNKPQHSTSTKVNAYNDELYTYHIYTHNQPHNANEGVGIIMNDHIAKHVIKTEGFENRILVITMCFRKNINIKIIVVYLPANKTDHKITNKCNNIIKEQITKAQNNNTQIILMGDFNIDVKDIKTNKHKSETNWKIKKEIITFINSQNLIDSTKYFQNTLHHTWTSTAHDNIKKCLDYIFTTQNIIDSALYGYIEQINNSYITTDHKIVALILNKEYFLQYRQESTTCKFDQNTTFITYKNIPDHIKRLFKDRLDNLMTEASKTKSITIYKQFNKDPSHELQIINQDWYFLKNMINKIKNSDTLADYKKRKINPNQNHFLTFPLHIRQLSNSISKLRNALSQFNKKRILRYLNNNNTLTNIIIDDTNLSLELFSEIWSNYWAKWNLIRNTIIQTIEKQGLPIDFIFS